MEVFQELVKRAAGNGLIRQLNLNAPAWKDIASYRQVPTMQLCIGNNVFVSCMLIERNVADGIADINSVGIMIIVVQQCRWQFKTGEERVQITYRKRLRFQEGRQAATQEQHYTKRVGSHSECTLSR